MLVEDSGEAEVRRIHIEYLNFRIAGNNEHVFCIDFNDYLYVFYRFRRTRLMHLAKKYGINLNK